MIWWKNAEFDLVVHSFSFLFFLFFFLHFCEFIYHSIFLKNWTFFSPWYVWEQLETLSQLSLCNISMPSVGARPPLWDHTDLRLCLSLWNSLPSFSVPVRPGCWAGRGYRNTWRWKVAGCWHCWSLTRAGPPVMSSAGCPCSCCCHSNLTVSTRWQVSSLFYQGDYFNKAALKTTKTQTSV